MAAYGRRRGPGRPGLAPEVRVPNFIAWPRSPERGTNAGSSLDIARRAGGYPPEFVFRPYRIAHELSDREVLQVGALRFEALAMPGHATGHLSYGLRRESKASILFGDAFFYGGHISLVDAWDCSR